MNYKFSVQAGTLVGTILSIIADFIPFQVMPDYEGAEKTFATVFVAALCLIRTHYG